MDGRLSQKTLSRAYQTRTSTLVLEILILLLLGIGAFALRSYLRIPLNIPGRHGLEFMALMMIGRRLSKLPFASIIVGLGAAGFMFFPFVGIKDPFLPIIYVVMGVILDGLFLLFNNPSNRLSLLMLIGGLSYMVIPVGRLIIYLFTGILESSFIKWGVVVPVISHFVFGIAGALLGAGLIYSIKRIRKE